MQSAKFGVLAICAALSLSACSTLDSDKIDYKSASKGVGLEVPPDLNQLSRDSRYTVPGGAATASLFQLGQAPQRRWVKCVSNVPARSAGWSSTAPQTSSGGPCGTSGRRAASC